ncbi:MAG: polymer-forming cytoskeletal protein [Chloroflexota bacterium]
MACIALLVTLTGVAVAQGVIGEKFRSGDTVTIGAGETVSNDVYAFAGTVRVDGTIDGDLIASGGQIDVAGTVTGDVLAAGGSVTITGTVNGDARVAGGTLSVGGNVKEDLLAAGGQLTVTSAGTVGEDVIAATGQLTIDGAVTGDVLARTGTYAKAGTIGGSEDVTITPRDQAPQPGATPTATQQVIDGVRHFLVVVLVGALLIWFAPRPYAAMKTALRERPLPAVGWGVVAIIGFIVFLILMLVAVILLAVVFGLLGFGDLVGIDLLGGTVAILGASLLFSIAAGYLADALVGVTLASLVMRGENASRWRELAVLAVGAAVVVLLSSLPVIGPWVKLVVILLGLGAVLIAWRRRTGTSEVAATGGWVQPGPTPQTPVT